MKKNIFIFLFAFSLLHSQDENIQDVTPSQFRLTLGYGFAAMNPEEVNQHIANSNTQMSSMAGSIKSMPELSGMLIFKPGESPAVIIFRGGYLWTQRDYAFQIPQTGNNGTVSGKVNGTLTETYSAYPISLGVGITNAKSTAQFQFEFIYGLGYIVEEGSYTETNGDRTAYSHSMFSPTYGFRAAGTIMVPISRQVGFNLELGYRYLVFDQFENEFTAQSTPFKFQMSGLQGGVGLSINL